jgi:hypothetical protein
MRVESKYSLTEKRGNIKKVSLLSPGVRARPTIEASIGNLFGMMTNADGRISSIAKGSISCSVSGRMTKTSASSASVRGCGENTIH